MLRHCSASTLSYFEESTLLRAMSLSNGRWAFSDSLTTIPLIAEQAGCLQGMGCASRGAVSMDWDEEEITLIISEQC